MPCIVGNSERILANESMSMRYSLNHKASVHEWLQLQVRSIDGIGRWSHFASRARGGPGGGIIRVEMCCNFMRCLLWAAYYLFVHIYSGTDNGDHTDPPTGKCHSYHYPACTCTVIARFLSWATIVIMYLQLNWILYCSFLVISDICSFLFRDRESQDDNWATTT